MNPQKTKVLVAVLLVVIAVLAGMLLWQNSKGSNGTKQAPANTNNSSNPSSTSNKELEACLFAASNSDANTAIIEQAKQDCYDKYQ